MSSLQLKIVHRTTRRGWTFSWLACSSLIELNKFEAKCALRAHYHRLFEREFGIVARAVELKYQKDNLTLASTQQYFSINQTTAG